MNANIIIALISDTQRRFQLDYSFDEDGLDTMPIRNRTNKVSYFVRDGSDIVFRGRQSDCIIFIRKAVDGAVAAALTTPAPGEAQTQEGGR
jgi:hypothetical protein